jgi:hypothetical protein
MSEAMLLCSVRKEALGKVVSQKRAYLPAKTRSNYNPEKSLSLSLEYPLATTRQAYSSGALVAMLDLNLLKEVALQAALTFVGHLAELPSSLKSEVSRILTMPFSTAVLMPMQFYAVIQCLYMHITTH